MMPTMIGNNPLNKFGKVLEASCRNRVLLAGDLLLSNISPIMITETGTLKTLFAIKII